MLFCRLLDTPEEHRPLETNTSLDASDPTQHSKNPASKPDTPSARKRGAGSKFKTRYEEQEPRLSQGCNSILACTNVMTAELMTRTRIIEVRLEVSFIPSQSRPPATPKGHRWRLLRSLPSLQGVTWGAHQQGVQQDFRNDQLPRYHPANRSSRTLHQRRTPFELGTCSGWQVGREHSRMLQLLAARYIAGLHEGNLSPATKTIVRWSLGRHVFTGPADVRED